MPQATRSMLSLVGAWLCAGALACLGDPSTAPLPDEDGVPLPAGEVSCTEDPRLDTYTADMEKPGELGLVSFRFSGAEPAPPAKGSNTFHVRVTGADDVPMSGDLRVSLTMPDHGHGTTVKPEISFDAATQEYTVTPLFLFMAGVWRIQFEAYAGSAEGALPVDRTRLFFCIEG
ncbi:MAG TPA: FixH family protein [Polyangiaceae bacterium]|nr:FixH family protein [Polyangiaceae bacterium]